MKVLVTGASGFIGRQVAGHLARAEMQVRAGSRQPACAGALPACIETCRLDVLDAAALGPAMAGMEAVVHCAVGDRATTVTGVQSVLRAARCAGVRLVVHLSSIAVYGPAEGEVDEATPTLTGDGPGYAHWKAAAEAICRAEAGPDLSVVILRPSIVYGAGSELWVRTLARRIIAGRWGHFGAAGEGICNLVHVSDVAAAVRAALNVGAGVEVFNINGPEPVTWNTWFSHFARAIGHELPSIAPAAWRRRSRLALPLKAAARIAPVRRRCETYLLGAPSASELRLFALRATYPVEKARRGLGWQPSVCLVEGTQDAVRWLKETGIVA